MERQTINFGNSPLLVFDGPTIPLKRRCMAISCFIVGFGITFGFGLYGGYLMNDSHCDGSF